MLIEKRYMVKKLYLHIGCGKTGSSALQNWLYQNANILETNDFYYPIHNLKLKTDYDITAGNGTLLYQAIINDNLENFLINLFSCNQKNVLLSSEVFQRLDAKNINSLLILCNKLKVELKVIVYIRNVYEKLYSSYMQQIKRHGRTQDLDVNNFLRFVNNVEYLNQFDVVDLWKSLVPEINVIHYDTERKDLSLSFLKFLDIQSVGTNEISTRIVNRSLSMSEAMLLSNINMQIQRQFNVNPLKVSTSISDKIIYKNPEKKVQPQYFSEVVEALSQRYSKIVEKYNQVFFGGKNLLKIHNENINLLLPNHPTDESNIEKEVQTTCLDIIEAFISSLDYFSMGGDLFYSTSYKKREVDGFFDGLDSGSVYGWANSSKAKDYPLLVEIFLDKKIIGYAIANEPRSDLKDLFGVDCAFKFPIPGSILLNSTDKLNVRVVGEAHYLKRSFQ